MKFEIGDLVKIKPKVGLSAMKARYYDIGIVTGKKPEATLAKGGFVIEVLWLKTKSEKVSFYDHELEKARAKDESEI
tara:strand:+ start:142 stop:372 length:231 start_codon:yes stop_codon:yes gene_type:complete